VIDKLLTRWRSWKLWHKVVFSVFAVFVAMMIIGGIASALGGGKKDSVATAKASPTLTDAERAYVVAAATAAQEARGHAQETFAALPSSTPRPTASPVPPPYKVALISASCTRQSDIGFNECQGFVKNVSGARLENVEVVIEWADANGTLQSSDEALIDYNPILPDQESPWKTIGSYNPALGRFRVRFKDLLGGTILTRDDRQR
jgi:hypothetical protein